MTKEKFNELLEKIMKVDESDVVHQISKYHNNEWYRSFYGTNHPHFANIMCELDVCKELFSLRAVVEMKNPMPYDIRMLYDILEVKVLSLLLSIENKEEVYRYRTQADDLSNQTSYDNICWMLKDNMSITSFYHFKFNILVRNVLFKISHRLCRSWLIRNLFPTSCKDNYFFNLL
jgi:hypothetical protein